MPTVLVFAGVDPSGGAGIAADVQAIAACGAHALPVITALTVQDNERVYEVMPVAADVVVRQARALMASMTIAAVKIGIPGDRANAEAIAALVVELRKTQPALPVVLDPVLASGYGDALARGDAVAALAALLPLATVLVPNLPEARALAGPGDDNVVRQAAHLRTLGCLHVLVTGGHAEGAMVVNRWFGPDGARAWRWPRLAGGFHGSGCTLASAIAARLAGQAPMAAALDGAQTYTQAALAAAYAVAPGQRMPRRVKPDE